jgi:hypothetical protein
MDKLRSVTLDYIKSLKISEKMEIHDNLYLFFTNYDQIYAAMQFWKLRHPKYVEENNDWFCIARILEKLESSIILFQYFVDDEKLPAHLKFQTLQQFLDNSEIILEHAKQRRDSKSNKNSQKNIRHHAKRTR